jgi:hypothetical protein
MSLPWTPPGWPREVRPIDAPGWERSAAAWLLDRCPPEFRSYPVLRRHEVVLARFTVLHLESALEAARRGMREARTSFRDHLEVEAIEAVVAAWQKEEARLLSELRAASLVEEALRGRRFVARL